MHCDVLGGRGMRSVIIVFIFLFLAGVGTTQAPSPEPVGTLAQLMRGILFPNSNLIFDVQVRDPGAPTTAEDNNSVTATFSGIYTGWQVIENSAVALAEVANLIVMPGRLCENGRPVPVNQPDYQRYAKDLAEAGKAAYEIAKTKDLEAMSDVTNDVAGACENCHIVYRRFEDRCVSE